MTMEHKTSKARAALDYHDRLCLSCFENTVQDGRYGGYFCSDACYERISNEETREPTPQQERWPSA